ncbi:MAG: hypothetical protein KDA45_04855 [Planctomycetales bacterium]|nr:hypothetical protein [Planctomycetales bacterium]
MTTSKRIRKLLRWPAFWIVSTLILAGVVSNLASGQGEQEAAEKSAVQDDTSVLLREGMRIEAGAAQCRSAGERLVIELNESGRSLVALENLASQRVLQAVLDDASDRQWIVNGQVTEFQGRNFLLLERVTRAGKE